MAEQRPDQGRRGEVLPARSQPDTAAIRSDPQPVRFIGSGPTQIAQTLEARDNNGALQLLIYGDVGDGGLSTVFSNDISQIPFALAWVTGDFTGTGNTQILQPWMRVFG